MALVLQEARLMSPAVMLLLGLVAIWLVATGRAAKIGAALAG